MENIESIENIQSPTNITENFPIKEQNNLYNSNNYDEFLEAYEKPISYRQPKPRLPTINTFFMKDMSYVSKSVYDLVQQRETQIMNNKYISSRKGVANIIKIFAFLYLTGMRVGELLPQYPSINPQPTITYQRKKNYTYFIVTRIAEKHITEHMIKDNHKVPKKREIVITHIPVDDFYEWNLWNYVTDNNNDLTVSFADKFRFEDRNNLTHAISYAFKTDLTDGVKNYNNRGLNCHILRHWRAFSLLVNKSYDRELIQKLFSWNDEHMLSYYASIKRMLNAREQLQIIDRIIMRNKKFSRQYYDVGRITADFKDDEDDEDNNDEEIDEAPNIEDTLDDDKEDELEEKDNNIEED